jgi:hypothetical protein
MYTFFSSVVLSQAIGFGQVKNPLRALAAPTNPLDPLH